MKAGTSMPRASDQSTQGRPATKRTVSENCPSSFLPLPDISPSRLCPTGPTRSVWGISSQGPSH